MKPRSTRLSPWSVPRIRNIGKAPGAGHVCNPQANHMRSRGALDRRQHVHYVINVGAIWNTLDGSSEQLAIEFNPKVDPGVLGHSFQVSEMPLDPQKATVASDRRLIEYASVVLRPNPQCLVKRHEGICSGDDAGCHADVALGVCNPSVPPRLASIVVGEAPN